MLAKEHIDDLLQRNGNVVSTTGTRSGPSARSTRTTTTASPRGSRPRPDCSARPNPSSRWKEPAPKASDLVVPYTKDQVKDAPRVDADGHLEPAEEDRLYAHYGLGDGNQTYTDAAAVRDGDYRDADYADTGGGAVGRDTSGPTTDDAMTRSEERLNVGTERQAAGRVRLRKYVTTENVTQTVPVQREEVRLEREPITDANRGSALSGPDISEEEHEIILHEERPVVEKETVPVERVRLDTETVTDEVTVDEDSPQGTDRNRRRRRHAPIAVRAGQGPG